MNSFLEYILENSAQYLIATFGQAKEYIEKYDCLRDTGLSMDDILKIFDYSLLHLKTKAEIQKFMEGRPEPFVADYNGKPGKFALRKWVATKKVINYTKISKKSSLSKAKNNLFAGFHNTTLKSGSEQQQKSGWQPSAQDYESLICLAYNVKNNALNDKEAKGITEALKLVDNLKNGVLSEDEISESDRAKVFYALHKQQLDACVEPLFTLSFVKQVSGVRLDKLGNDMSLSNTWKLLGHVNGDENLKLKPDNTPKTDIITSNKKLRISCKKANGALLMSGALNEAVATILTALYRTFGKESSWPKEIKILKELLSNKRWKKIKFTTPRNVRDLKKATDLTPEELKTLADIKQGEQELSDIKIALYELITKNKKFENNLLYEAATGNVKFGGNIDSESTDAPVANIIFVWNIEKLDESKVYKISDYIKHLQTSGKLKYELSYKTSGSSSTIGFRIVIK